MHTKITLLSLILISAQVYLTLAQGCSDAGFCTINSFKPDTGEPAFSHQVKVGVAYGKADFSVSVISGYVEYTRQFSKKFSSDVKFTSLAQSGNSISAFGLSDVYVNTNYQASPKIKFTLGAKIPLHNASKDEEGLPLPMDYQSSLGTFDMLAGVGFAISKVHVVAAWQQPLTQNKNAFLATDYSPASPLSRFPSTRNFKRSGDVLLRVSYPFKISDRLQFTASALPIYHLANDRYTDNQQVERAIEGSQGLTLNLNAFLDYKLNDKSSVQLNAGFPTVVREARPDGLTRSFIATLEYRIRF
jgi:hypothetical protein